MYQGLCKTCNSLDVILANNLVYVKIMKIKGGMKMAVFVCSQCGYEKDTRCKPKKCTECGAEGTFQKKE